MLDALPGLLLVQGNTTLRKTFRRALERDSYAVLAVNSLGEALARLHARRYRLVVCTDLQRSTTWADDYELLIDRKASLSHSGGRYELYMPALGIGADAVMLMPSNDPDSVRLAVAEVIQRLDRARGAASAPPPARQATA